MPLEELKAIAEAATPGPWFVHEDAVYSGTPTKKQPGLLVGFDREICRIDDLDVTKKQMRREAKFIATFNPALIAKLLAVAEAAQVVSPWLIPGMDWTDNLSKPHRDALRKALAALEDGK